MKTRWTKADNDTLIAEDEETRAWLAKRSRHAWIEGEFKEPRNGAMHRKFFALVKIVYESLPEDTADYFPSKEAFRQALAISSGHREQAVIVKGDGTMHWNFMPKSISFAKMDQGEFEQFYDRCCDVIIKNFWFGMDRATLKAEVAEMCEAGGLSEIDRMPPYPDDY